MSNIISLRVTKHLISDTSWTFPMTTSSATAPCQLMSCMVPKMCFQLESYWYGEEQFLSNTNEVWGDILRRSAQKLWAITGKPCFAFQGAQLRNRPVKITRKQTRLSEIRRYICTHAIVIERLCFILLLKDGSFLPTSPSALKWWSTVKLKKKQKKKLVNHI